ncbi:ECE1-like protein [Mya arenaria]|uniref:ECE1-like protein n=1 Tax=Mya arenaria TaxID=6604 RepID=A0ABY7E1F4_MYAAR|nr:ECE1-like protein [Mya arenaria]
MSKSAKPPLQRGVQSLKFTKTDPSSPTTGTAVRFSTANSGLGFSNPNFADPTGNPVAMADNYKEFDGDTAPIIPEIKISSYSFRVREIILAVVSLVAFITCLVLIALVATNGKNAQANTSGVAATQTALRTLCTDPSCLKAASWAVSNMNTSVNPCDDFFEYACGNYQTQNPLDPDVRQRTIFWNMYYENEDKLRSLLEVAPARTSSWSSEKKLKDFFMSCIDDYGKMKAGGRTFIEKIVVPMGGWDVLNTFNADTFDLNSALQKTSVDFWTAALFTFRVTTDRYDRTRRVDMSGMGMSWTYYTRPTTEQIRRDYKKFMRTVGQLLARDSGLTLDRDVVANKLDTFVNDAFDIEFQLANITANTVPTEDPHNHDRRVSLTDLTQQTNNVVRRKVAHLDDTLHVARITQSQKPLLTRRVSDNSALSCILPADTLMEGHNLNFTHLDVDFVSFFRYIFGPENVNGGTRVVVKEDDWVRRMLQMVADLPATDKNSRDFFVDQFGVYSFLGTNKHCFSLADKKFPDALGALFVKDHFVEENRLKVTFGMQTYSWVMKYALLCLPTGLRFTMSIGVCYLSNDVSSILYGYTCSRHTTIGCHGNYHACRFRKLSNYLIWRLARRYAQEISYEYTHANRIFYEEVWGWNSFYGDWHHCFWHASHALGDALGALYAKQHFKDKNKSKVATALCISMRDLINSDHKEPSYQREHLSKYLLQ